MIESIQIHLHDDEEAQLASEKQLSEMLHRNFRRNLTAFSHHIPPVAELINSIPSTNLSVFCNKSGEPNIVDYGQGRVFYGLHPEAGMVEQYQSFKAHPLRFDVDTVEEGGESTPFGSAPLYPYYREGLPEHIPVLVVLGAGMGFHIRELLKHHSIDHMIVYEPDLQMFKNSVLVAPWEEMLRTAHRKNTAIYLQAGNDGNSFFSDISELSAAVDFNHIYVYRHYNTPVFSHVVYDLAVNGLHLKRQSGKGKAAALPEQYIPAWTGVADPAGWKPVSRGEKFNKNLAAFEKYVPDVYQQFKDYEPLEWCAVDDNGSINIVNKKLLVPWYAASPEKTSQVQFEGFCKHPRKDGIVLGYKGDKLKHYLHYQFVARSEELLNEVHEKQQSLPERVKSLIVFGLGSGYDLAELSGQRVIEKLFICEPNRDFFYASLFAIDWAGILEKIDEQGSRIYLNVGDDGTHLFTDLLNQFHSIGPYVLAQTYFYQSYYDEKLNDAVAKLREQLQVVIAMGEYFDHAYFGISHTRESMVRQHRFLLTDAPAILGNALCDTPVFIVGNGPSVDDAIDVIKENRDSAIIISCGTAIKVLHRHGIKPDFHAEIEQNRSTFDWAKSVYDDAYLKEIDLISCNGFHPDTANLFRQCYLAFKEGESSTVSTLAVLNDKKYQRLKFAFPTVSNFVANVVLAWGMRQLYLFGVDLGFKDAKNHHSKSSGYYTEDGQEVYDYSEKNNVSIRVPGNFSPVVNTKYEFKVAATSLEQALSAYKPECYNTADGARISGAVPLRPEMVLVSEEIERKQQALKKLRGNAYVNVPAEVFSQRYFGQYSESVLRSELNDLQDSINAKFEEPCQIEKQVESQKIKLFDSYSQGQSLLFYFFYGSMNYYHAVLSKILGAGLTDADTVNLCDKVREDWSHYFDLMKQQLASPELAYDVSVAISQRRVYTCLAASVKGKRLAVLTNNQSFKTSLDAFVQDNNIGLEIDYLDEGVSGVDFREEFKDLPVVIYFRDCQRDELRKRISSFANDVIIVSDSAGDTEVDLLTGEDMMLIRLAGNSMKEYDAPLQANDYVRASMLVNYFMLRKDYDVVLPKVLVPENVEEPYPLRINKLQPFHCYDACLAVVFSRSEKTNDSLIMPDGHRAIKVTAPLNWSLLSTGTYTSERLLEYRAKQISSKPWLNEA